MLFFANELASLEGDRSISFNKFLVAACLLFAFFAIPSRAASPLPQSDTAGKSPVVKTEKLDINTASREQLMKLPGITEIDAQKIIAGRPYRMKTDLVRREILSKSVYEGIREIIIARQPKKKKD